LKFWNVGKKGFQKSVFQKARPLRELFFQLPQATKLKITIQL